MRESLGITETEKRLQHGARAVSCLRVQEGVIFECADDEGIVSRVIRDGQFEVADGRCEPGPARDVFDKLLDGFSAKGLKRVSLQAFQRVFSDLRVFRCAEVFQVHMGPSHTGLRTQMACSSTCTALRTPPNRPAAAPPK